MMSLTRKGLVGILAAGVAMFGAVAGAVQVQPDGGAVKPKAKVGEKAPEFKLVDIEGKEHKLSEYTAQGKIVVLEWFNADCPYVKKHHVDNKTMANAYNELKDQNVVWLAINTGADGKQGAGLDRNKKAKRDYKIEYPILLDQTGDVGRSYVAKTTPHMYVISETGVLLYAGAIDNDPSPRKVGEIIYPVQAIKQHKAGETITDPETEAYGCSVKY